MHDPFDLRRFVEAQAGVHDRALAELRAGHKTGHWMWFVFPQVCGLGRSHTAAFYAIRSLDEARAYLAHPVLGPRLAAAVEAVDGRSAQDVFGWPDVMKFRSSLTLFEAAGGGPLFGQALDRWFEGERDPQTLQRVLET